LRSPGAILFLLLFLFLLTDGGVVAVVAVIVVALVLLAVVLATVAAILGLNAVGQTESGQQRYPRCPQGSHRVAPRGGPCENLCGRIGECVDRREFQIHRGTVHRSPAAHFSGGANAFRRQAAQRRAGKSVDLRHASLQVKEIPIPKNHFGVDPAWRHPENGVITTHLCGTSPGMPNGAVSVISSGRS
jgi:hypothetical protein